jgi:hypothetical protein
MSQRYTFDNDSLEIVLPTGKVIKGLRHGIGLYEVNVETQGHSIMRGHQGKPIIAVTATLYRDLKVAQSPIPQGVFVNLYFQVKLNNAPPIVPMAVKNAQVVDVVNDGKLEEIILKATDFIIGDKAVEPPAKETFVFR